MIAAPAHMEAHRLLRDIPQGVVEGIDAQRGELAILWDAHVTVNLPRIRQVRVVNLEQEAGVGDGLVLLMHGIRDGVEKILIALVILVFHPMLDGPGRHSRQKRLLLLHTLEGSFEVVDVGLDGSLASKPERASADHLPAPQVASAGKIFCELLDVAAIDPRQRAPWFGSAFFVPAETLAGVVRKVSLAELAVVDAVETNGNLLLHDLGDRAA